MTNKAVGYGNHGLMILLPGNVFTDMRKAAENIIGLFFNMTKGAPFRIKIISNRGY